MLLWLLNAPMDSLVFPWVPECSYVIVIAPMCASLFIRIP